MHGRKAVRPANRPTATMPALQARSPTFSKGSTAPLRAFASTTRKAPYARHSYIGGATPSFSTTTNCAPYVPPLAGAATTNTFLPAIRSARVAGASVTTGTLAGTVIELLPPLYESFRSRPFMFYLLAALGAILGLAPGPRHDDIERSARRRPQHQPTSSAAVCASRRF